MLEMKKPTINLRHISIQNYKGIDILEMEFPQPLMTNDPDVLVMGSENGVGKTSVLECCALLLLATTLDEDQFQISDYLFSTVDIPDIVIRAGAEIAQISGKIMVGNTSGTISLRIYRDGSIKLSNSLANSLVPENLPARRTGREVQESLRAIWGFRTDPIAEYSFLLFNSYRKVQEGNPDLGMMIEKEGFRGRNSSHRNESTMSAFKIHMLRMLMVKADLFEFDKGHGYDPALVTEKLNELMRTYAGGTINKLRPSPDNTVDFRIDPIGGGPPFTFDGLSSGQKEIISTLFLIWFHTRENPLVVLIDEPELHLNAQWHRSFVRTLFSLAPNNQYIISTHSEFVMDSVDEDRRVMLSTTPENVR